MGFSGVKVDRQGFEAGYGLLGVRRPVYFPSQLRVEHRSPHQKTCLVSSSIDVGEEAVDDVRLRGKKVDGVHGRVHIPLLLDSLDI